PITARAGKPCRSPLSSDVRELPVDFRLAGGGEGAVDGREGLTAAEAVFRGQGRWMRSLNDRVPLGVDQAFLLLGIGAPEHEDDRILLVVDLAEDGIGEGLPALALV